MAESKVFFVHLRRPYSASHSPNERRSDPFYEFGSFGCTGCHSSNLFHPRNAEKLTGARLAFVQGGRLGARLIFLTPPIVVRVWADRCEARWTPAEMPFKYAHAPVLAWNGQRGDFPLVEEFARATERGTIEGGLTSRLRSRARPLTEELAREVVAVYGRMRKKAPRSAIASTYDEALPHAPPKIDRDREATYEGHMERLDGNTEDVEVVAPSLGALKSRMPTQSRCRPSQRRQPARRERRCS